MYSHLRTSFPTFHSSAFSYSSHKIPIRRTPFSTSLPTLAAGSSYSTVTFTSSLKISARILHTQTAIGSFYAKSIINFHPRNPNFHLVSSCWRFQSFFIQPSKSSSAQKWKYIAFALRITRIPFLIFSIYYLGYQQGITDYARNPNDKYLELLENILWNVGWSGDWQKIHVARGGGSWNTARITETQERQWFLSTPWWYTATSLDTNQKDISKTHMEEQLRKNQLKQIVRVGEKIVTAARTYVDSELETVVRFRTENVQGNDSKDILTTATRIIESSSTPSTSKSTMILLTNLGMEEEKLTLAKQRLDGCSSNNSITSSQARFVENKDSPVHSISRPATSAIWSYILIDSPIPNAFVSEIIPQTIFVTTTMMDQFISNDDELALVLGHEVSHLILGHNSEINAVQSFLRTFEILILSITASFIPDLVDGGFSNIVLMAVFGFLRAMLAASHSRQTERDADTLGIILAARACFDTKRASEVFWKMTKYHLEGRENDENNGNSLVFEHKTLDQKRNRETNKDANLAEDHTKVPTMNRIPIDNKEESVSSQSTPTASPRTLLSILDSHPPSHERYLFLGLASQEENAHRYKDTHCASLKKSFWGSLLLASKEE